MSQQFRYPSTSATLTLPASGNTGSAVPAQALQVGGKDGSGNLRALSVDTAGVLNVSASSLPLPSGAATAAKQDTGNASLASIDGKIPASLTVTSTRLLVDGSGVTQPISAVALPLPAGASTAADQATGNASLASIDGKTPALGQALMAASSPVVIASNQSALAVTGTFWQATQPVSVASLPLPSGAATSALQTTGNTSLASIDGKLGSLGQKTMAGSAPVVIASDQSPVYIGISNSTSLGVFVPVAPYATPVTNDPYGNEAFAVSVYDYSAGTSSGFSGTMTNGSGDLFLNNDAGTNTILICVSGTWTGTITANYAGGGPSTAALSFRTFNSGTLSSSITANGYYFVEGIHADGGFTLVNGVATGAADVDAQASVYNKNTSVWALQAGAWNITNISGTVSLPTGAATAANQSSELTLVGAVTETAPATDTASSGLNGRLQRIAQRLTSLIALLPTSLGQKTMANGLAVTIASDQSAITTAETTSSTATVTSVASSGSSVSLLASNASRKGATFFNDSTSVLYLKLGTTASTSSYTVQIPSNGYYELPFAKTYTGAIDGIWSSANGNARITELT